MRNSELIPWRIQLASIRPARQPILGVWQRGDACMTVQEWLAHRHPPVSRYLSWARNGPHRQVERNPALARLDDAWKGDRGFRRGVDDGRGVKCGA